MTPFSFLDLGRPERASSMGALSSDAILPTDDSLWENAVS
jgi:hypothetical protein